MDKEKLNLPIIRGVLPFAKHLSMKDYLEFVNFHLEYTFDRKASRVWKKKLGVNVPFFLK